ncbi:MULTISPECIES: GGDEF domain-containing protein [unclassified Oceanobacter]|uniref:GGDEF domain-containing protein n=1 Tax=unclassified Oceanobacter TaxID=2620260 RepID=UPI0026E1CB9C|nr:MULTISPECIES: GGDEF domain-containing protein [unclassified Oceanobacter]MDO6682995.1 GGDEF domain-containing protein [Oceanobacter sp. 5_MG-2023]MDP2507007.1 GGDEF domain-containing protein [Oceanobacter sp. 3_MG-2023]
MNRSQRSNPPGPNDATVIDDPIRPETLLHLALQLQSTLELRLLIELFFQNIQNTIPIDGISYRSYDLPMAVCLGRVGPHRVNHSLNLHDDDLGELIFFRATPLYDHEQSCLHVLLGVLRHPLRNALLYQKVRDASFRDPLTGAGNRIAMEQTLEREIELSHRHNQQLSLLMLDMDNFKAINDQYGHNSGDEVLQSAVQAITDCMRQTDLCFRFGGEEFLVLLSNAHQSDAMIVANRIRETISQRRISSHGVNIAATASIGCASLRVSDSRRSLIHRADQALYSAKHQGRNRVVGEQALPESCATPPD